LKRDKLKKLLIVAAIIIFVATVIHHFLICGRLIDVDDFLHHESILTACIFFIVGFYVNEFINLYLEL
jgi:hypothetical protein